MYSFIKSGWHVLEPSTPFIDGWHIRVIANEIQRTLQGWRNALAAIKGRDPNTGDVIDGTKPEDRQLLVNVPPGAMKSLIVSVFAPAWMWLHAPEWRAIFASTSQDVVVRDSMKRRDLMKSEWYQQSFKPKWKFSTDQDAKLNYKNDKTGVMQCVTVGGTVVGNRADALFVDDPLDAQYAFSKAARDAVLLWWDQAFANRLNDLDRGVRVVIMQRLHEEDLSGHLLKQGGWNHLMLPMEFDTKRADARDPRTIEGEPLNLRRFPLHIIASEKKRLGPWGSAGQLQQSPVPIGGEMFSPRWWRYWSHDLRLAPGPRPAGAWELPARQLPQKFDLVWTSWDCTFKDLQTSDWVVGTVWGKVGADFFLLAVWRRRAGLVETIEGMKAMAKAYPKAWTHLIEDKANGSAAIEMLKSQIPGILAVEPRGGKESRAAAIQPIVAAGNVFLPEDAPWLNDYVLEFARFPKGAHDDQVDSSSQAISNILNSAALRLQMLNTPLNG